ncbi:hypothetical protein AJ80_03545 [Polytolypa hystricis UAMH7299]|uniref:Uncharacterized protein n=1 Tax=Polytolypa hystricis (strain UAMH7299) TaxID=1447883 RepID=A0A2B7YGU7_POLH7|nr:hypothetical protein AJ80_03545 [Polytolypa hystricis UAMH7299]
MANKEERHHPSGHIFFNPSYSKVSIHRAPTQLHHSAIQNITASVFWRVMPAKVNYYSGAEGEQQQNSEIGVSEDYADLVKNMKSWLEGPEGKKVKIAFLVKLTEQPRYSGKRCYRALQKEVIENAERYVNDREGFTAKEEDLDGGERGKMQAYGATFVGRITAFFEIWERDEDSGDAVRRGERVHFYDSSKKLNPRDLSFNFDDFVVPVPELQGEQVKISWKSWAAQVASSRGDLAFERFRRVLSSYVVKPESPR